MLALMQERDENNDPIAQYTMVLDLESIRRQTVTAAGTTNFIWDGQDVLLETDVSNNIQVTYTQTPAGYGDLVSQQQYQQDRA